MSYYLNTYLSDITFQDAEERVIAKLEQEGFGIITAIDVKKTLKMKLDVDFKNYTILGACNPGYAHKAMTIEDKIGVLLPCNVLVIEQPDGRIEVAAVDPATAMGGVSNEKLGGLMSEVTIKLQAVLDSLNSKDS